MGNHHHEDERYKKYYDRPPRGEVPADERVRQAKDGGTEPVQDGGVPKQVPEPAKGEPGNR
ncbi:hypothetical protein [Paeniglutamicibacter kerguelensis]|uniref:Uncharacterized protein n=1 Tax=Paeniglutamicibacter kerguelensis TaxID=254788 RepID=A0ABS4XH27_9MICC|nr:hypothetical protein [Paeniglutamicibacter kerguelensis]MBP2387752.1 hypothetical protein [Paeniglutamicibacter kerguelensis]